MSGIAWTVGWFVVAALLGVLTWAMRTDPNEATSNLAKWARKFGIKDPPAWLRAKVMDRRVRATVVAAFCILIFLGGMQFRAGCSPHLDHVTVPSLPIAGSSCPIKRQPLCG
jgi:hypothetical protein